MKTILVDAVFCIVSPEGQIFDAMYSLLETYPNKRLFLLVQMMNNLKNLD
jgi:hypothetical protein